MRKSITKQNIANEAALSVNQEISKVSAVSMMMTAAAIGCWAAVSLFAGTVNSDGPVGLVKNLITAIAG